MSSNRERRSTLNTFVVRLWCEPEDGHDRWHGQVQRLQSGEHITFSNEASMLSFIRRWVQMSESEEKSKSLQNGRER